MGQERRLFKSEESKQRSEVSEFLRQIAGKIESGQVILRQGQEEITLDMPANLILEIQVEEEDKKSKGMQHSLEIEIKWFEGDGDGGAGGSLELG
jgi:amphi-Trp domain-containing protein